MKDEFLKDYLVSRVISFGKQVDNYGKIYYQTNEDLIMPYIDIDFKEKEVLSVLASGDHVLTSRFLEAKKTDAFDFNRLAEYYFYLRLWSIEYKDELYPLIMDGNNRWLIELLEMVKPQNDQEKRALSFFKKHIKEKTKMNKLFFDVDSQPQGRTLYTKPQELEDSLSRDLEFYQLDLFKDFYLTTTYDIVLISNILEWARKDPKKIKIAHDNLSRLLKSDGLVVGSRLLYKQEKEIEEEKDIFSKTFTYEQIGSSFVYKKIKE